jgi:selenocysteine lyase/cysteine desulfurase
MIVRVRGHGGRVRCASDPAARSAIVMVEHDDPKGAVDRLATQGIIVDWRPGYVRLSPHFYNSEEEVDRTVDVLFGVHGADAD